MKQNRNLRLKGKVFSSKNKSYSFLNALTDGASIIDAENRFQEVNHSFCKLTGYSREELLRMTLFDLVSQETAGKIQSHLKEVIGFEKIRAEAALKHKDEGMVEIEINVTLLDRVQTLFLITTNDLTRLRETERQSGVTLALLKLFTQVSSRKEYLDQVVQLIQGVSGCRCVGLRILDAQGNIPLESYVGYDQKFWDSENWLSINTHQCACIRVITGKVEAHDLPVMTPGGSFFCNNIQQFISTLTDEERSGFRGVCALNGYYSVIIIPINYQGKLIGAIHMGDESPGKVPLKIVQFIESLAPLVGESILRLKVEESLKISQEHFRALRKRGEEMLLRNYDTQTVINSLLRGSLQDTVIDESLKHALDLILSIPWLSFESSGCILLVEDEPDVLVMKAQNGLDEPTLKRCARVPFNWCLCGRAGFSREIQFADCVDERHQVQYDGIQPHGHYCVPIVFAGKTFGVINIYLKEGHSRNPEEEDFLSVIANTLAGIIARKRTQHELRESEERYRSLVKQSSEGVFILDPRTKRIQEANMQLLAMLGYTEEEIKELTLYDIAPNSRNNIDANIQKVMENNHLLVGERQCKRKDGSLLDVEINSSLIQYGKNSVILSNIRDVSSLKQAREDIQQSFEKLQKTLEGTVYALAFTAERRDPYTAGHQQRVAQLACEIAKVAGLEEKQIDGIRVGGILHDIGKISVPSEILTKPGQLTDLEMGIIRTHPQVGYDILKTIEFPWPIAQIVLQHQERIDGSGYPQGLSGEDILLEAKFLAVADVVEAMASHRPYRPSLGVEKALGEISQNCGVLYDPDVVAACLRLFDQKRFTFE